MSATTHGHELLRLSAREAGALFRRRELSPVELTSAVLQRIEQTEPDLHAFVLVQPDEALATAYRAERDLQAGVDHGPLHGIPVAVKDIFDLAGAPTRCGSRARDACAPATADAEAVAALRRAGAVLVGKTVTQEFAAGVVSAPARNPWDPTRIPGGSSGGSAAAVATGAALVALGSDTGGSIRIPAAAVGIVGLKPTYGRISTRGVFPLSWSLDTVGPLAGTVEDAVLALNVLLGSKPRESAPAPQPEIRGTRIGVARPFFFDRVHPEVRDAVDAALALFADLGAEVIEAPWPDASAARAVGFVINRVESAAVHGATLRDTPDLIGAEFRSRLEAGRLLPAVAYLDALRARAVVKRTMSRLFEEHRLDALAAPTLPTTAVRADRLVLDHEGGEEEPVGLGYTRLTMPFNATGQPVLALPCGFDTLGLPISIQLAGRPFGEDALCRIGHAYERAAGWHLHRPIPAVREVAPR